MEGSPVSRDGLLSRWSLFLFTTHAQLFLFISFSLLFLLYPHYFLISPLTSSPRSFPSISPLMIHTKRQGDKIVIVHWNKAHYSYCRREGPATFSETFLSGPPRSGLSALSTSSSSTKTWETFSSQRLAVCLKRGAGIGLGSGLGVTGVLSGAGEGSSIS